MILWPNARDVAPELRVSDALAGAPIDAALIGQASAAVIAAAVVWYLGKVVIALSLALRLRFAPEPAGEREISRAVDRAPWGARRIVRLVAGFGVASALAFPPSAALAATPGSPSLTPVLDRIPIVVESARPAASEAPGSPAPDDRTASRSRAHVVAEGESLWQIAQAELATSDPHRVADYVAEIHRRNTAVIGSDPDVIRPGQRLVLP